MANNWAFMSLSVFGKIIDVKSFIHSKISHISAVLLTPSQFQFSNFDKEIYNFIRGKNSEGGLKPSIVIEDILYAPKTQL